MCYHESFLVGIPEWGDLLVPDKNSETDPYELSAEPGKTLMSSGFDRKTNDRELSTDEIYHLLQNRRRRAVLNYLRTNDTEATIDELAEYIAAAENGISTKNLSSQQRKRVYVSLYQIHLPMMDDAGVVNYDSDRGTVVLGDLSYVGQFLPGVDTGVPRYLYVALAVAALAGGLCGVGAISALSPPVWIRLVSALTSTLALVAVVVVEVYRRKVSLL